MVTPVLRTKKPLCHGANVRNTWRHNRMTSYKYRFYQNATILPYYTVPSLIIKISEKYLYMEIKNNVTCRRYHWKCKYNISLLLLLRIWFDSYMKFLKGRHLHKANIKCVNDETNQNVSTHAQLLTWAANRSNVWEPGNEIDEWWTTQSRTQMDVYERNRLLLRILIDYTKNTLCFPVLSCMVNKVSRLFLLYLLQFQ